MPMWIAGGAVLGGAISGYGASKSGTQQETGPSAEDIRRARKLFGEYMDYAQEGLFDISQMSKKNRQKTARKLFQLQNVGERGRTRALERGYNNAQGRLKQTNQAMQAAILGIPYEGGFMQRREIPVNLDRLQEISTVPDLQGISRIKPPTKPNVLLDPNQNQNAPLTSEEIVQIMGGF